MFLRMGFDVLLFVPCLSWSPSPVFVWGLGTWGRTHRATGQIWIEMWELGRPHFNRKEVIAGACVGCMQHFKNSQRFQPNKLLLTSLRRMIATECLFCGIEGATDFPHISDIQLFITDSIGLQCLKWLVRFNGKGSGFNQFLKKIWLKSVHYIYIYCLFLVIFIIINVLNIKLQFFGFHKAIVWIKSGLRRDPYQYEPKCLLIYYILRGLSLVILLKC